MTSHLPGDLATIVRCHMLWRSLNFEEQVADHCPGSRMLDPGEVVLVIGFGEDRSHVLVLTSSGDVGWSWITYIEGALP